MTYNATNNIISIHLILFVNAPGSVMICSRSPGVAAGIRSGSVPGGRGTGYGVGVGGRKKKIIMRCYSINEKEKK